MLNHRKILIISLIIFSLFFSKSVLADCLDSDFGQNYYTRGETQGAGETFYADSCYCPVGNNPNNLISCEEGPYLREYYCGFKDFVENIDKYECEYGCFEGACLTEEATESNQIENDNNQEEKSIDVQTQDEAENNQAKNEDSSEGDNEEEIDENGDVDGNNAEEEGIKIVICYVPPERPGNAYTKSVVLSAAKELLAEGGYLGECGNSGQKDDLEIKNIKFKVKALLNKGINLILEEVLEFRDSLKEKITKEVYLEEVKGDVEIGEELEEALNNFLTYGVDSNTNKLGAGERAAVIHSFKRAFNKLPESEEDLEDMIKIANGRWPEQRSETAEEAAKEHFEKIYLRPADMTNPHDEAAIVVMAYGLRQKAENRNLESEARGIKTFFNIYGYYPSESEDWDIMQAITYSGASR